MNPDFFPTLPKGLINPFFIIRRRIYESVRSEAFHLNGKILDYGCGSKPYKSLFKFSEYIGVDIENPGHSHKNEQIDFMFDGNILPFPDKQFDCCFSTEVFEHVFNADKAFTEIHRVLKENGKLVITIPFVWDEHEIPHDFCRYTSFGIRHVLEKNGFTVLESKKYGSFTETIFQMIMLYLYKATYKFRITRVLCRFLCNPILNLSSLALLWMPKAGNTLYLGQIVVAKKV